ncbi:GNAT family N-acetyltransferase [Streptomyces thermospinosisporus]|uniref:GNAT family N-acetyltransferase n=1 Tax=Streptomyces thermospinosisporus TaxID=161482 RepID=UPI0031D964EA
MTGSGEPLGDGVIRAVRAEEWRAVKELRLTALRDPVAHLAYLETYEHAAAQADDFWRDRTARTAEGSEGAQQFIAVASDARWVGSVTVLVEEPGTTDWTGAVVEHKQGHLVGVYVRPEERGSGLTEVLFDAALDWSWAHGVERVRLFVHEDNTRAYRFYRRVGFEPSGLTVPLKGSDKRELELVLERG